MNRKLKNVTLKHKFKDTFFAPLKYNNSIKTNIKRKEYNEVEYLMRVGY